MLNSNVEHKYCPPGIFIHFSFELIKHLQYNRTLLICSYYQYKDDYDDNYNGYEKITFTKCRF